MQINARLTLPVMLLAASAASPVQLSTRDTAAAFRAGGFKLSGRTWRACDAPKDSVYIPGAIEEVRDINGDGRPEAVITESSTFCYGGDEVGFAIVSKQADSTWKLIIQGEGIPTFLKSKGTNGWPEIELGGARLLFPGAPLERQQVCR